MANRWRRLRGLIGLGLVAGMTVTPLAACSSDEPAGPVSASDFKASDEWAPWGELYVPSGEGDQASVAGPVELGVPEIGVIEVAASDWVSPEVTVVDEFVTTAKDGDETVLVSVSTAEVPGVRAAPAHQETWVVSLRINGLSDKDEQDPVASISEAPLSKIASARAFIGDRQTATLAGTSDLGVISLTGTGDLVLDFDISQQVVGIDAVRGSDVWAKDEVLGVYGYDSAIAVTTDDAGECAVAAERYQVATGIVEEQWDEAELSKRFGSTCVKPEDLQELSETPEA